MASNEQCLEPGYSLVFSFLPYGMVCLHKGLRLYDGSSPKTMFILPFFGCLLKDDLRCLKHSAPPPLFFYFLITQKEGLTPLEIQSSQGNPHGNGIEPS